MKNYRWLLKGDFFKLWSSTFFSQFSAVLFFYSLIWWSLSEEQSLLTGSIVIGIGAAVSLLISPIAGWLADRYPRGKLLAIVDGGLCLLFLLLAISFSFVGVEQAWIVLFCRIIISAGVGSTDAASRSLVQETVLEDRLDKAIGFQESLGQTSQLIAPAIAGIIIYLVGIDGIWYICAILTGLSAVLELSIRDRTRKDDTTKLNTKNLLTGFTSVRGNKPLRYLLYGTVVQQLLFSGFAIYIAAWSTYALHNTEWISGILQAVWGFGSLAGALMVVFLIKSKKVKKPSVLLSIIIGFIIAPLGFVTNIMVGFAMLALAGIASGVLNVYLETHLQRQTTTESRSRELSAFFAINNSLMPIGYVLAGVLAEFVQTEYLFLVLVIPFPVVAWFIYKSFSEAEQLNKNHSVKTSPATAQIRVTRQTDKFKDSIDFYEKGIGLIRLAEFTQQDKRVIFGPTNASYHLEITAHVEGDSYQPASGDNMLVFYIREQSEIEEITNRLHSMGYQEKSPENDCRNKEGVRIKDPDGRGVILMNTSYVDH
ncbi:MFS transporter [Alkalibacillus silvisoli]|uniref:MFS transporter n=1 Tax=Alkalibacillus silvisoli TaxID=392823 RepID=A0ABP3JEM4_9BACI